MSRLDTLAPLLALVACLLVGPLAFVAAPAQPGKPALAIFAPWRDGHSILATAQVPQIAPVSALMGYLIAPRTPADLDALSQAGAWIILDATTIAKFCGTSDA